MWTALFCFIFGDETNVQTGGWAISISGWASGRLVGGGLNWIEIWGWQVKNHQHELAVHP